MSIPDHLKGPWGAYLLDENGYAYPTADEARDQDETEFHVAIVRRTAMPRARIGRVPGNYYPDDYIVVLDEARPLDDDDDQLGAASHLQRAQAMAHGLNLAAGTETAA